MLLRCKNMGVPHLLLRLLLSSTLVRLTKDVYEIQILRKTLETAKLHMNDLFGDLVENLEPFLYRLHGSSLGNNIAAIIDPSIETVKDHIVSKGNA
ncbi:unnamed protein product [Brassica rapa subsp. narinosa]